MKNQTRWRSARGMATWLKVVLIAAGLCLIGGISLCVFLFFGYQQLTSPAKIRESASIFMTLADPLPTGFNFAMGGNFMDSPFVVITSNEDKALYTFFTVPQSANTKVDTTPEQAIDEIAKGGNAPTTPGPASAKKLAVSSHDTLEVGGQKMPYVIGHAEQPGAAANNIDNTFFGAIKSSSSGKMIFMMVQSTDIKSNDPKPLTIDTVKKLTNAITKF